MKKFFIICFLLLLVTGCASKSKSITRLTPPLPRNVDVKKITTEFSMKANEAHQISIGEELFRITRSSVAPEESVDFHAPGWNKFPSEAIWTGTHTFHDKALGDLIVYTTRAYRKGSIGIILDLDGYPVTKKPLIQVGGMKRGRRWGIQGTGRFLNPIYTFYESWGVRYGGLVDNFYLFEIVDKNEANISEIIQTIKIAPNVFLDGFIIRKVLIKGLEHDVKGVIKYKIYDKFDI